MKSVYDKKENCCGCSACKQICPTKSIRMEEDINGYLYPVIDINTCIDCMACIKVCPLQVDTEMARMPQQSYAYVNLNAESRLQSASSGAFEALCMAFLQEEGNYSIYGCELDDNLQAKHCSICDIKEIYKFKKSKYLQSKIDNEYISILRELKKGKKVIFSGTPCQVAALNKFLKKDFENLFTIDFVCHGVPNQKIFSRYIEELEKKNRAKVKKYIFRNKRKIRQEWNNLGVRIDFSNGKSVEFEAEEDLYMTGFLSGLFNRDSCYKCKFASLKRISDVTIGDFWGIDKVYPELSESKTNGTSLIMCNTLKGIEVIQNFRMNTLYSTSIEDAVRENGQLRSPQKENKKRTIFLKEFRNNKKFSVCMRKAFPEKYGFNKEKIYQMNFYIKLSKIKKFFLINIKSKSLRQ